MVNPWAEASALTPVCTYVSNYFGLDAESEIYILDRFG